jgi:glycolate oxidase FAD binding subunit
VIAEVTFRLHPISHHAASFTVSAAEMATLIPLMEAVSASHLLTEGLQLRGRPRGFHLDILLSTHPDAKQAELLRRMTEGEDLELKLSANEIWLAREVLFAQSDRLILKATMLPTEVLAFASEVAEKGGEFVAQSLGILYAAFPADERSFKHAEEFRYHVGLQGGTTFVVARSPSAAGAEMWAFATEGEQPEAHALMREIKRRFDPNRTLNPGRFVGGI